MALITTSRAARTRSRLASESEARPPSTATAQTSSTVRSSPVREQAVATATPASLAPANCRPVADPVTAVPEELRPEETPPPRAGARADAPGAARLPQALPGGVGERARRFVALHRADVVRAGRGRAARRRRRPAG